MKITLRLEKTLDLDLAENLATKDAIIERLGENEDANPDAEVTLDKAEVERELGEMLDQNPDDVLDLLDIIESDFTVTVTD